MRKTLPLSELQSRFKAILKSADLPEKPSGLGCLDARLGVYHHAYFVRIEESLAEDFPRIREILGEDDFSPLIWEYLEKYPSRYPSLAQVGQNFSKFLGELTEFVDRPWMTELAAFEWQHSLCGSTADGVIRDFSDLTQLSEEQRLEQTLLLSPSVRFFKALHRVHEKDPTVRGAVSLALFSVRNQVLIRELSAEQEQLLDRIHDGSTLGEILGTIAMATEHDERSRLCLPRPTVQTRMSWIFEWVATGLITGFQAAPT